MKGKEMHGPQVCLLVGAVLLSLIPCQAVVNNLRTEKHTDVPPPPPLKKAIKLGDWNFEDRTESMRKNYKGPWFIMFHMPWCHHCKVSSESRIFPVLAPSEAAWSAAPSPS